MEGVYTSGNPDSGIITGNHFNKYQSGNPVVKHLMSGFRKSLLSLIKISGQSTIHDIGCGEGYWVLELDDLGFTVRGSDFSNQIIAIAKENAVIRSKAPEIFGVKSIYELTDSDSAELLLCCEVLEHLEYPELALSKIAELSFEAVIFSVPNEPIWRILNMLRAKYLKDWGNTPGHLNHWSPEKFRMLISKYFIVKEIRSPFPWSMVLAEKRSS